MTLLVSARILRTLVSAVAFVLTVPVSAGAAEPSPAAAGYAASAFDAVAAGRWSEARSLARQAGDPVVVKLVVWHDIVRRDTDASFREIAGFIDENPDWPWPNTLQRRAEAALDASVPSANVVAWFEGRPPLTREGGAWLARALVATGRTDAARDAARRAWVEGAFGRVEESDFLDDFGRFLTSEDHQDRLERLLWAGRRAEAERMLAKVDPGSRALAIARLDLRGMRRGVDRAIARVPTQLQRDPGLVYERVRWRRKKDRDEAARSLLVNYPLDAAHPERWWTERSILARRALADGYVSEAYRVASGHGIEDEGDFAEAEWLAGWIALRYLRDPRRAREHFQAMHDRVRYPISLARGAYWIGRAEAADGRNDVALQWYRTAAAQPTTFYGQLAALELSPGRPPALPADPVPTPDEAAAFNAHELTRAVRVLAAIGEQKRLPAFVLRLASRRDSPGWKDLAAALSRDSGRPDLGVFVGKQAYRTGNHLIDLGYPALRLPTPPAAAQDEAMLGSVERQLVLAVIRQESAYRVDAVSPAGARGLMQLMPATARRVAKKLGVPYSKARLTADPDYNMTLGRAYMSAMLDRFDGSYVLALAAYNAGPGRSVRWKRANGDPAESVEQAVDWIEAIPFNETRNYVQRTLENLQVYRGKETGAAGGSTLKRDLLR